jgi:uncharacterized 2Fe-2S/4Fe-4S cluster protein (DUF4445 family)
MTHSILFQPSAHAINVPHGTLISDAAKRAGVFIDSPCGGNGTCKKCAVVLEQNGVKETVLACQTKIVSDCVVYLSESAVRTLREGTTREIPFAPCSSAHTEIEGACFAAFDLGTTTIVCYLLDAKTGAQLSAAGTQNPQSAFGADVIARASYALNNGYEPLHSSVRGALNELLHSVCADAGRGAEQVVLGSVVGNTVMIHLLRGDPVDSLVRAPYQPFRSERLICSASDIGLHANETCTVLIPPVVGGFVGADTVACLTATAFDTIKQPTLLLDVGTNGELALTDGEQRVSCSTAAGPAFEGANISCGMRASRGAIEHVWLEDGELRLATIDQASPVGICGSGLIELAALLAREGVIEESGRLSAEGRFASRVITQEDGQKAFRVAEHENGSMIVLTQKDVRELQLGKAAMRAGIEMLLEALQLEAEQVERALLAGAFGSHLSPDALCEIGLLPPALSGKVESIGNAAGEGAKLYLKNYGLFEQSERLALAPHTSS